VLGLIWRTLQQVRWNACYAIGNAFHNPALQMIKCECFSSFAIEKENKYETLQELALYALTTTLTSTTNFKVSHIWVNVR
jgi:hypothetical protein